MVLDNNTFCAYLSGIQGEFYKRTLQFNYNIYDGWEIDNLHRMFFSEGFSYVKRHDDVHTCCILFCAVLNHVFYLCVPDVFL